VGASREEKQEPLNGEPAGRTQPESKPLNPTPKEVRRDPKPRSGRLARGNISIKNRSSEVCARSSKRRRERGVDSLFGRVQRHGSRNLNGKKVKVRFQSSTKEQKKTRSRRGGSRLIPDWEPRTNRQVLSKVLGGEKRPGRKKKKPNLDSWGKNNGVRRWSLEETITLLSHPCYA